MAITQSRTRSIPAALTTPLNIVVAIVGISTGASIFLVWLVFFHSPIDAANTHLVFLPTLNALLNLLCTVALLFGFRFILREQIIRHRNSMFTAFFFSTLFLASYITNHALHGDAHFQGQGLIRPVYFALLISHILLSILALPMILITFFFSLTGRFPLHRRIARYTFPVWLYVSVTGVIVYAMLASFH